MLTTNQNLQQGRYRIISQLGQNGVGMGYEAYDTVLEANVLLKEIRDNLSKVTTPAQLEMHKANFAGKAKILTEMKHESLLLVKDFFSEIDRHYLVTEFIDGNTLGELLEKKKSPFPLADVANWADALLDALNYLHTQSPQIIHREVKPQNVRLSPNGKIKLLVFNIVKSAGEKSNDTNASQTFDAAVLPYLPLEQIWGGLDAASQKVILTNYDEKSEKILEQQPDVRSDVYALGATLYHLLTARIPVDALTRSIDILEGKSDPLQSPKQVNPSVPVEISDVLMKSLEIKRENRFSSAVIMRQVLRTAFVRVKEREAKEGTQEVKAVPPVKIEEDAVLEIPVVEVQPAPAVPAVAAKIPEIESEQARQLDLIKKQLREAEARRLEAEQRAAEAEQRLLEAKKHITAEPVAEKQIIAEPVAEESKPVEEFAAIPPVEVPQAEVLSEPSHEFVVKDEAPDDFEGLFAEPQKEGNVFKKVAAAAIGLIVLGGAGFGIWSFTQTKSTESTPTMTSTNAVMPPSTSVETTPSSTNETAPVSSYQATSETSSDTPTSPSTDVKPDPSNPATVKIKATATPTPAQAKKPTPTKTTETQKKVTLDDLLKDN